MKIINLTQAFTHGGIETAFIQYEKNLKLYGYEVFNILSKSPNMQAELPANYNLIPLKSFLHLRKYWQIFKYIYKIQPDIIISHVDRTTKICKFLKKFFSKKIILVSVAHFPKIKTISQADYVIALTEAKKNEISKYKDSDYIYNLPHAINFSEEFKKSKPAKVIKIGFLGRLCADKGLEYLIEALSKIKNTKFEFIIAGEGDNNNYYFDLLKKNNIDQQTTYLGWVNDIKSFFAEIDIFVMPSLRETFCIALIEAAKYSVPVITTNCQGPKEIFDQEGLCEMVPTHDAEALANSLEKYINDYDLACANAKNAYQYLKQKYDEPVIAKQLNNIIEDIKKRETL